MTPLLFGVIFDILVLVQVNVTDPGKVFLILF